MPDNEELHRRLGIRKPWLCPCGKRGRNSPDAIVDERPATLLYEEKSRKHFLDFNKSAEWVGGGCSTWQMKIISQRVYRLLKEQRIALSYFYPIAFV